MSALSIRVPLTDVVPDDDLADVRHFGSKQIAEMWCTSKSLIDKLIAAGELKSRRIAGCRRVSLQELRDYLERNQ